jgi:hypothetical protein
MTVEAVAEILTQPAPMPAASPTFVPVDIALPPGEMVTKLLARFS